MVDVFCLWYNLSNEHMLLVEENLIDYQNEVLHNDYLNFVMLKEGLSIY